jgi:hypothetical protein
MKTRLIKQIVAPVAAGTLLNDDENNFVNSSIK